MDIDPQKECRDLRIEVESLKRQVAVLEAIGPGQLGRIEEQVGRNERLTTDHESRMRAMEQFRWSLPAGMVTAVAALVVSLVQIFR